MQQTGRVGYQHQVVYDDTPVATHALNVVEHLQKQGGSAEFSTLFAGKSRPQCVGMFLALLELIRRARVRADQDRPFGQIYVFLLDARPLSAPEVAESFGPEGGATGPVGMAARPPLPTDQPSADQESQDAAEDATPTDEPDLGPDQDETDAARDEPHADRDQPDSTGNVAGVDPAADTGPTYPRIKQSGAEHDTAGDHPEAGGDGPEPAAGP